MEVERLFKQQTGKLFPIFQMLKQSCDFELRGRHGFFDAHNTFLRFNFKLLEERAEIFYHKPSNSLSAHL